MITGFNTDIVVQGVTYHVQTEDKGVRTPLILSLVYDRGTILASKRSPYDDLLTAGFNESELADRLHRQHKLMCAAVRAGRIEDLRQMTLKESAAKQKANHAQKQIKPEVKPAVAESNGATALKVEAETVQAKQKPEQSALIGNKADEIPPPQLLNAPRAPIAETPTTQKSRIITTESPKSAPMENPKIAAPLDADFRKTPAGALEDLIIEEVQIVEEEMILPAEAVQIIAEPRANESVDESLKIELPDDITFKSGERKTLSVRVTRGNQANGLSGAHVMVKILGSSFRPLIFHAKTDSNGAAIVYLQLPQFTRGRAAILVRAMSGGEETELRRIVEHD